MKLTSLALAVTFAITSSQAVFAFDDKKSKSDAEETVKKDK